MQTIMIIGNGAVVTVKIEDKIGNVIETEIGTVIENEIGKGAENETGKEKETETGNENETVIGKEVEIGKEKETGIGIGIEIDTGTGTYDLIEIGVIRGFQIKDTKDVMKEMVVNGKEITNTVIGVKNLGTILRKRRTI